jgi:hypothetical protein
MVPIQKKRRRYGKFLSLRTEIILISFVEGTKACDQIFSRVGKIIPKGDLLTRRKKHDALVRQTDPMLIRIAVPKRFCMGGGSTIQN